MVFVQQTKEQTYKFTGSQRECSFMLMSSGFDIFLACCNGRAGDCLILPGVDVEKLEEIRKMIIIIYKNVGEVMYT